MNLKKQRFLAAAFCVLVITAAMFAVLQEAQTVLPLKQNSSALSDLGPLLSPGSDPLLLLRSPNPEQRDDGGRDLLRDQENRENQVQAIAETFLAQAASSRVKNPRELNNQEAKHAALGARNAIGLLGAFRSTHAIPFLVAHLSDGHVFIEHPVGLGGAYPCAGALVSIGSPCLDSLLLNAAKTDNAQTTQLTAYVFVKVLGSNVAAAFVEDRRRRLTRPAVKRRLDILEHIIQTDKFPF